MVKQKREDIKPNKENRKPPRWFYVILLSIPVVFIVLLEVSLRFFNYGTTYDVFIPAYSTYPNKLFANPDLTRKYFTNIKNTPSVIADGFDKDKSENCFRVFVFGESSTAGWPYVPNASFPRELKRMIEFYYPELNVEVVNLGISAINTYTILDLVPAVLEQKPDLVVFYNGHNEYYGALGVASSQSLGNSNFLINLYLYLQDFRTFQLISSFLNSTFSLLENKVATTGNNETLMERMAGDNLIEYKSDSYYAGIEQFNLNMEKSIRLITKKNIPIIIGSLVSNLKDIPPFESLNSQVNPRADAIFSKAVLNLKNGDLEKAKASFYFAKELDGLRFRAPEDLNNSIKNFAKKYPIYFVDLDSIFSIHSTNGIIGYELTVDHLHPNITGYKLIAKSVFSKIEELKLINGNRLSISEIEAESLLAISFPFTQLDSLIADFRIRILTGGYPFQPKGTKNLFTNFKPQSYLDTLAIEVIDRWTTWEDAHYTLSQKYLAEGNINKAAKEISAIIADRPYNPDSYKNLARLYIRNKLFDEALSTLLRLSLFYSDDYTNKWIGQIYLDKKEIEKAIKYLQKSLVYNETDPQIWYNLTGAYILSNQLDKARLSITRCLQIDANYPNARNLYQQLFN